MNFKLASEISQLLDTNQLLGHPYIWSRIKVVIVSSGEPENVGRALVERNDLQEKTKSNNLGHFSIVAKVEERLLLTLKRREGTQLFVSFLAAAHEKETAKIC